MAIRKTQQSTDAGAIFVMEALKGRISLDKLSILHFMGVSTLSDLFDLLVQCDGDVSTYVFSVNSKDYSPFSAQDSDAIEIFLSQHPATKAEFEQNFEIKPSDPTSGVNDVKQAGQQLWQSTLRVGVNGLSRLLDPKGTDAMLNNGSKSKK